MKQCSGVWLPDRETHLVEMLQKSPRVDDKGTYQLHKLTPALRFVKQWRRAVDVGAHVGLWSTHLVKKFDVVSAFEPNPDHTECLFRNVQVDNIIVYEVALGAKRGEAGLLLRDTSTGDTSIDEAGSGVPMYQLDEYEFHDVDFLKVDVEGYELYVVQGGEKTIKECKPVIVIEQKPKGRAEQYGVHRFAAVELLKSWGAKLQFEMSGDYCLVWP